MIRHNEYNKNYSKSFQFAITSVFVALAFVLNFLDIKFPVFPGLSFFTISFSLIMLILIQYYCDIFYLVLGFIAYFALASVFSFITLGGIIGVFAHFIAYLIFIILLELFLQLKAITFTNPKFFTVITTIFSFFIIVIVVSISMALANKLFLLKLWGISWKTNYFYYFFLFNFIQYTIISVLSTLIFCLLKKILKWNRY